MRVAVVYNIVERRTAGGYLDANYESAVRRFVDSYIKFNARFNHDLYICTSGASLSARSKEIFDGLKFQTLTYRGHGWDIGAYQYCARRLKGYDFLVCMNSQVHIVAPGWLAAILSARQTYGPGVYGTSSSFEIAPHIRTSCIATEPELLTKYPLNVRCRYDACLFEHSPRNFSLWARGKGYSVCVVSKSSVRRLEDSRSGCGIFRRDSQTSLLVRDRHTQIYDAAPPEEREHLQALADGRIHKEFIYLGVVDRLCERHRLLGAVRRGLSRLRMNIRRAINANN